MSLDRVYVALDSMTKEEIDFLLTHSNQQIKNIKIGLELFLSYGPSIVTEFHEKYKTNIFLDLKLHDIPNTVSKSIASLKGLPIKYLTVHLSGGRKMLEEALISSQQNLPHTKLLGVSFLTSLESIDTNELFGINLNEDQFTKLFTMARETKIHGVVCSPMEIALLKKISPLTECVTPGVRFDFEISNLTNIEDQKRVLSVNKAFELGADFVVMGRSITKFKNIEDLKYRLNLIDQL